VRVTRQGWRVYRSTYVERLDPRGRPYYWLGAERPDDEPTPGTDIAAIQAGCIAVTPQQPDLTAHGVLAELVEWWE
jgi:5'-nucleotidase